MSLHRKRNKSLGLAELVAIALGGMVGGGIFTILGISVSMIGYLTPLAILIGGLIALLASYSYVKLGLYYQDEGATFAFVRKTYVKSHAAPAIVGWLVIFGYISTLALYAYTFSSYAISGFSFSGDVTIRKLVALAIIAVFTLINVWSVNGMGKIEDLMVYTKLVILAGISVVLIKFGSPNITVFSQQLTDEFANFPLLNVLIVSSVTFVAYEGFQLVINAVNEMRNPQRNIPRAIYTAIALAILIYLVISVGALLAIPTADIIKNKEFALAAGAEDAIGTFGRNLVILGAVLATSSAISGTVFGASRQIESIAQVGYMPKKLAENKHSIPIYAVLTMSVCASILILVGGLELILEFGSITFLLVSLLMAVTNFKIRKETKSSFVMTAAAFVGLGIGSIFILYYEFTNSLLQMLSIVALYIILTIVALIFAKRVNRQASKEDIPTK